MSPFLRVRCKFKFLLLGVENFSIPQPDTYYKFLAMAFMIEGWGWIKKLQACPLIWNLLWGINVLEGMSEWKKQLLIFKCYAIWKKTCMVQTTLVYCAVTRKTSVHTTCSLTYALACYWLAYNNNFLNFCFFYENHYLSWRYVRE